MRAVEMEVWMIYVVSPQTVLGFHYSYKQEFSSEWLSYELFDQSTYCEITQLPFMTIKPYRCGFSSSRTKLHCYGAAWKELMRPVKRARN